MYEKQQSESSLLALNEEAQPSVTTRRIGNTTFVISTSFSKKAMETVEDKFKRLILNEVKKV